MICASYIVIRGTCLYAPRILSPLEPTNRLPSSLLIFFSFFFSHYFSIIYSHVFTSHIVISSHPDSSHILNLISSRFIANHNIHTTSPKSQGSYYDIHSTITNHKIHKIQRHNHKIHKISQLISQKSPDLRASCAPVPARRRLTAPAWPAAPQGRCAAAPRGPAPCTHL